MSQAAAGAMNVLGSPLAECSRDPLTGYFRDGCCRTRPDDLGLHVVCAEVTAEFLRFSKARGNDLTTPILELGFPGLLPGDRWCLCATRWLEAWTQGMAPPVVLVATHQRALDVIPLEALLEHGLDRPSGL